MTTIINTPPSVDSADSGLGLILGIIVAIMLFALFFIYGLPYIRNNSTPKAESVNINVQLPETTQTSPVTTNP